MPTAPTNVPLAVSGGKYLLEVTDRNYTVVGVAPVYATSWSDVDPGMTGWKFSTIYIDGLRLPFVPMRTVP
jgi:hypothetical protein